MRRLVRSLATALGVIVIACAGGALTQDSPYCKANTDEGQAAYRDLRAHLSLRYPERLVRQIDVIPRCPFCMHTERGFVIEAVYSGSDAVKSEGWSAIEEVRHLALLKEGVITRFRIRYLGDDCFCCDQPAHSTAAWIDKTSAYDPPADIIEVRPPPPPDKAVRGPEPPPWRQVQTLCPDCKVEADERNDTAKDTHDLQVERVGVVFDLTEAQNEYKRWSEYGGYVRSIPIVPGNKAAVEKALSDVSKGMDAATADLNLLRPRLEEIDSELEAAPAELAAADAALTACEASACHVAAAPPKLSTIPPTVEQAVLAEINRARTHPEAYVRILQDYRSHFQGRVVREPGDPIGVMTIEGTAAVDDAITFMQRQAPLPPLESSAAMNKAAARLAGDPGAVGHRGSDGSTMTDRLHGVGVWAGEADENISFGQKTGVSVVIQFLTDDGVLSRAHRTAIFALGLKIVGVHCGPHTTYGTICVVELAGALMDSAGGRDAVRRS